MRRIDELFAIERDINGKPPDERRAQRQERSEPLVDALKAYLREQRERLSPKSDLAKAIRYLLVRWASFTRFLDDGRICLSNNATEREALMTDTRTYDSWFNQVPIDDRNERPPVIALVAIVVAWVAVFVVTLA